MKNEKMEGPLETAVRLLAKRDYSEGELSNKLKKFGYSTEEIRIAIVQLCSKGYLDDARVKLHTIEKLVSEQRYGIIMLVGKLRSKSLYVSAEEIRQFLSREDEWNLANKLVEKHFKMWEANNCSKIARFLYNRGFSQEVISQAAEKCLKHQ